MGKLNAGLGAKQTLLRTGCVCRVLHTALYIMITPTLHTHAGKEGILTLSV